MASVELSLSETFHKHKRNLVLLCAAIAVLRIASPSKLKLPFVGAEVDLPSSTAFILLGLALAYMFVQYYIEYRTMRVRHSSTFIDVHKKSVDDVIDLHLQAMTKWVSPTEHQTIVDLNSDLATLTGRFNDQSFNAAILSYTEEGKRELHRGRSRYVDIKNNALTELDDDRLNLEISQIEANVKNAIASADRNRDIILNDLKSSLDAIAKKQDLVAERLEQYSATYGTVARSLNRVSSSIGSAQRIGFQWIDGYLVIGFAALALAGCVTGALGWWIEPPTPVVGMPWFPSCLI